MKGHRPAVPRAPRAVQSWRYTGFDVRLRARAIAREPVEQRNVADRRRVEELLLRRRRLPRRDHLLLDALNREPRPGFFSLMPGLKRWRFFGSRRSSATRALPSSIAAASPV
jgi:hypothetical protein